MEIILGSCSGVSRNRRNEAAAHEDAEFLHWRFVWVLMPGLGFRVYKQGTRKPTWAWQHSYQIMNNQGTLLWIGYFTRQPRTQQNVKRRVPLGYQVELPLDPRVTGIKKRVPFLV